MIASRLAAGDGVGRSRWGHPSALALAALALVVLGTAWIAIDLTRHTDRIAAIWPANAVVLAVLLRTGPSQWPGFLAAGYAANVAANLLWIGGSQPLSLALPLCNTAEVLLCAAMLRLRLGRALDLTRGADLAAFAVVSIIGPALSAILAATILAVGTGAAFDEVWRRWTLADVLGLLIFVPPLLAAQLEEVRALLRPRTAARAGALLLLVVAVTVAVFAQSRYPALFAIFPALVLVAFLLGNAGAVLATLIVAIVSIGLTASAGLGPLTLIPGAAGAEQILVLQAFLLAAVLVTLPVATALAERQRLLRTVAEARQHLDAALAGMADGLFVFDPDDRLVLCNARGRELLPKMADILVPGAHYRDLVNAGMARGQYAPIKDPAAATAERVAAHQATRGYELERNDGRWFEVVGRHLPEGGIVNLLRDITEFKRAASVLTEARAKAEAADRAKSEFLATMSHEIRTPMTAILGMADLLAGDNLPPHAARHLGAIRASGRQLLAVINDVLDVSRIEAGTVQLEIADFDIPRLVEEVGSILCPQAVERGLVFAFELPVELVPVVRGDPTRLRQVLLNLVGNALKFTEQGRVAVAVARLPAAAGSVRLRFEVRDTGIGIPPEQQAILFRPFAQADGSVQRRFGGSGLGLAICKRLVEAMGGEIGVDSLPGVGSLFWFEIALALGDAASASAPSARTRLVPASLPPLRILVAEDAELNRELIAETLARHGHTVVLTEDGAGAVAAAEHAPPFDVVLMDIQMPRMNGEEAARRIRQLPGPAGSVPIIALTANVVLSDRNRYIAAGMDACLIKPIVWTDLFGTISRCLHDRGRGPGSGVGAVGDTGMAEPSGMLDDEAIELMAAGLPSSEAQAFMRRAVDDAAATCTLMRGAAGRLDQAATGVLAHRLAGTAATFGLAAIARSATVIEAQAAQGHFGLLELTDDLARAVDATRAVLAGRPLSTLPWQAGTDLA